MSATPIDDAGITATAFRLAEIASPSSLGDDSPEAREAQAAIGTIIDACLAAADWSFASRLYDLPEIAAPDIVDHLHPHAFQLPPEVLKVRDVGVDPTTLGVRYRIDGRVLRTDVAGPLRIRASVRPERESDLPAEFRLWVAHVLAAELAARFATSRNRVESLLLAAQDRKHEALGADRAQASPARWDGREDDPWSGHGGDWALRVAL